MQKKKAKNISSKNSSKKTSEKVISKKITKSVKPEVKINENLLEENEALVDGEETIDPDILEEGMLEEDINPFHDKYEE